MSLFFGSQKASTISVTVQSWGAASAARIFSASGDASNWATMRLYRSWLFRRGQLNDRRKALRDLENRYHLPVPNKALIDLIDFVISTLDAATWVDQLSVEALPIKEPRTISESHKKALLDGRAISASGEGSG